jgi:16S rRNA (adenine1518-N6/adenine1519-N6)-dimethyltransferase
MISNKARSKKTKVQSSKPKVKSSKSKVKKTPFAKRSLGQNFLIEDVYIEKIVAALNLTETDTVIEIGPGRAALTQKLVESGANVIAIELDRYFVPMLRELFAENKNFTVYEQDALNVNFAELTANKRVKLIANLPYNISTAILQRIIEQRECFSELILMLQLEVVERITAKIGNSERGFLSVMVENSFTTEKLFDVPPTAFRPIPKVMSAVTRLITLDEGEVETSANFDETQFRKIVSLGFMQKRKTILNNFKFTYTNADEILQSCEISPSRRAETLTVNEWKTLAVAFKTAFRVQDAS